MADLAKLIAWRDELERRRFSGVREVESDGERVRSGSDAELAAAIAAVNQQIAELSAPKPVRTVVITSTKGL